MAVIPCIEMPAPPELPELTIPQFGVMQAARQSLYDLPDLSTYIMSMQEMATLALAPLRRFLEMIEVILAIKNCTDAVIDALMPPSPTPIFRCLKELVKAIARLASFFPPFEYIKTMLSICNYVILTIDEVMGMFVFLDERISEYKANLILALELGDVELGAINDCAGNQITVLVVNAMDLLKYLSPLMSIILDPLARIIPEPTLRKKLQQIADLPATLTAIQDEIENTDGLPVLGDLMETLVFLQNISVTLYNLLAPLVGLDGDKRQAAVPVLENF